MERVGASIVLTVAMPDTAPMAPDFKGPGEPGVGITLRDALARERAVCMVRNDVVFPVLQETLVGAYRGPVGVGRGRVAFGCSLPTTVMSKLFIGVFVAMANVMGRVAGGVDRAVDRVHSTEPEVLSAIFLSPFPRC